MLVGKDELLLYAWPSGTPYSGHTLYSRSRLGITRGGCEEGKRRGGVGGGDLLYNRSMAEQKTHTFTVMCSPTSLC